MPPVRRLTAILAADVAGYSRLMGTDEEGTHARLKAHLGELVEPMISQHRGRTVKNTGGGLLAEFVSVVDAVRCAVEIQRGIADREPEVPEEQRIRFRIGINLGDVIVEEHDIFGDGVNVAARLEGLTEPGGICVSRIVHDQVRDKLDFVFEDLGEQQVKNIARPVHVYRILLGQCHTLQTHPLDVVGARKGLFVHFKRLGQPFLATICTSAFGSSRTARPPRRTGSLFGVMMHKRHRAFR
jgi:class 3 adenylate cyclase